MSNPPNTLDEANEDDYWAKHQCSMICSHIRPEDKPSPTKPDISEEEKAQNARLARVLGQRTYTQAEVDTLISSKVNEARVDENWLWQKHANVTADKFGGSLRKNKISLEDVVIRARNRISELRKKGKADVV